LRKSVFAVVLAMVAMLGAYGPVAAAPRSNAKVVIIVGATHGETAKYRSNANELYAEAIKHTSNVVRVYSPNATWSAVKAATNGANVVIYFGHGNGWPSPYTYDPAYKTKDGFGLNASAGHGDSNNVYYGEPSIRTLNLAPNAIVFLHHLCYASGNSEPGKAAPTLATAKARVDNYGSAFLAAGASAVIADGHSHTGYYLEALFTTGQPLKDLWQGAPNYHGHDIPFTPTRSTGTAILDPDSAGAGFYRSIVGDLSVMSHQVIGLRLPPGVRGEPGEAVIPGREAGDGTGGGTRTRGGPPSTWTPRTPGLPTS
jgi:hypothetical protein